MNIFSMIQEKKNQFRKAQSQARDSKLLKSIADRREAEDRASKNEAITENRKKVNELRMAPIKKFSSGIRARLEQNAQNQNRQNNQGNIFTTQTKSDSRAGNIFTAGSGSNPFDFSDKKLEQEKPRNIIIKIGK